MGLQADTLMFLKDLRRRSRLLFAVQCSSS